MPIERKANPGAASQLVKQSEMRRRRISDRRNAHQPRLMARPCTSAAAFHEVHRLARRNAGLLRLLSRIDLNEQLRESAFCACISFARTAAILSRSTLWMTSKRATASRVLFDCSGPDQMQLHGGENRPSPAETWQRPPVTPGFRRKTRCPRGDGGANVGFRERSWKRR